MKRLILFFITLLSFSNYSSAGEKNFKVYEKISIGSVDSEIKSFVEENKLSKKSISEFFKNLSFYSLQRAEKKICEDWGLKKEDFDTCNDVYFQYQNMESPIRPPLFFLKWENFVSVTDIYNIQRGYSQKLSARKYNKGNFNLTIKIMKEIPYLMKARRAVGPNWYEQGNTWVCQIPYDMGHTLEVSETFFCLDKNVQSGLEEFIFNKMLLNPCLRLAILTSFIATKHNKSIKEVEFSEAMKSYEKEFNLRAIRWAQDAQKAQDVFKAWKFTMEQYKEQIKEFSSDPHGEIERCKPYLYEAEKVAKIMKYLES